MKKLILSSFAIAAFAFISNSASAQEGTTQTSNLGVKIATVMEFTKTADNIGTGLVFTTAAHLTDGVETDGDAVQLNYKANKATRITIQATQFASISSPTLTMPVGILEFKNNAGGGYKLMTSSPQFLSGTAELKNGVGEGNISVGYKVTPGLTYSPADDYSATITYTITAL